MTLKQWIDREIQYNSLKFNHGDLVFRMGIKCFNTIITDENIIKNDCKEVFYKNIPILVVPQPNDWISINYLKYNEMFWLNSGRMNKKGEMIKCLL